MLLLGYFYASTIGGSYTLVTIGLVSFVAALQFAPVIVAALYWKDATKAGALSALIGGFAMWLYTLLLPVARAIGLDRAQAGPRTVRSASRCSNPTRCLAWTGSIRSRMPPSGP